MDQNIWLDERAMAVLIDARDKLQQLGAVCEITPASVPGEGIVAALFASFMPRALQASLEAHDMGVAQAASEERAILNARIEHRVRSREVEDAASRAPRLP